MTYFEASLQASAANMRYETDVFRQFRIQMIGPDGSMTETTIHNFNDEDGRVDEIYAAADKDGVSVTVVISNPSVQIVGAVQSLQTEALGYEETQTGEEDQAAAMLKILSSKIDALKGMNPYPTNRLKNMGCVYIWQIVEQTEAHWLKKPRFGRKSLRQLKAALQRLFINAGLSMENVFNLDLDLYRDKLPTPPE